MSGQRVPIAGRRAALWVFAFAVVWAGLSFAVSRGMEHTRRRLVALERQPAVEDFPTRRGVLRARWNGTRNADNLWLDMLQGAVAGKLGGFRRLPGEQLRVTLYVNADAERFGPWVDVPGAVPEKVSVFWPAAAYSDFRDRVYEVFVAAAKTERTAASGKPLDLIVRTGASRAHAVATARQQHPFIYSNWWRLHGADSFTPEGAVLAHVPVVGSWRWLGVTCGGKLGDRKVTGVQFSPAPASFIYRPGVWTGAKAAHAAVAGWIPGRTESQPIRCIVYFADGTHRIFSIVGEPARVGPLTLIWRLPPEVVQRLREASPETADPRNQGSGSRAPIRGDERNSET